MLIYPVVDDAQTTPSMKIFDVKHLFVEVEEFDCLHDEGVMIYEALSPSRGQESGSCRRHSRPNFLKPNQIINPSYIKIIHRNKCRPACEDCLMMFF